MNDDFDFRFTVAAIVFAFVALFAALLAGYEMNNRHVERMASLGFQRTSIPGQSCPEWTKVP